MKRFIYDPNLLQHSIGPVRRNVSPAPQPKQLSEWCSHWYCPHGPQPGRCSCPRSPWPRSTRKHRKLDMKLERCEVPAWWEQEDFCREKKKGEMDITE